MTETLTRESAPAPPAAERYGVLPDDETYPRSEDLSSELPLPPRLAPHAPAIGLFRDLLRASQKILVTTHQRPDGDAIGAILACARAFRQVGKDVTAHAPDAPPSFLAFLPDITTITTTPPPVGTVDLVMALDHSELARTGLARELLDGQSPVVAIDHHVTSDRVGSLVVVLPEAAATCEILSELLPVLGLPVDSGTATCLLTGIVTDTGSFQHANTSPTVLRTASFLLERGANLRAIVHATFGGRPLPALRIMGRALERIETNPATGAAVSIITHNDLRECGATLDDLSGVVNMLNSIPEASFSLLLTEYERGKVKGSLRSEPEHRIDVSKIAQRFGGGGHALASGFEVAGTLVRDDTGWRIS